MRVVGSKEQRHARDIHRVEAAGQRLLLIDQAVGGLVDPVGQLPLGHDPAGDQRVDADAVLADVAGERAGQAVHGGLGRGVGGEVAGEDHPADRAEIDDRALLGGDHAGQHRLGGKEGVLGVDGDRLVPELGRHLFPLVAEVVGGVVDQRQGRAVRGLEPRMADW